MADDRPAAPIFKKISFGNGTMFTLIFFVGNLLILAGSLWVSNGYVSKATFEAYQISETQRREARSEELKNIAVHLGEIQTHMQGDAEQNRRLNELEREIRDHEMRDAQKR